MELLLEGEVASILRCSVRTVQRLIVSGKLEATKGRPVLIDRADLKKYLDSRKRRLTTANSGKSKEDIAVLARQIALRGMMARKRK